MSGAQDLAQTTAFTESIAGTVTLSQVSLSPATTMAVSTGAGMVGTIVPYPFSMWKNQVITAPPGTSQREVLKITAEKGFFRGVWTAVGKMGLYSGVRLGLYPTVREMVLDAEVALGIKKDNDPAHANLVDRCLAASTAGLFGAFLLSPFDVCLVLQTTSKRKLSFLAALRESIHNSGFQGLWRGFSALGTRAVIGGAAMVGMQDHTVTSLRQRNAQLENPYSDNTVINTASVISSFVYAFTLLPIETARVRMSNENHLPLGAQRRYTNVFQCVSKMIRDEGLLTPYRSFFMYFPSVALNTVLTFFCIEYGYRELKIRKAKREGLTVKLA